MYIGARGSGGFTGSKLTDHAWGGPAAAEFAGSVNSDIENGKIKSDAPPAQLYDLDVDVNQTRNLYNEHPEVVKEMSALLASYAPPSQLPRPKVGKSAPKTPAMPSTRSASFDFESGKLAPWKVVDGNFGHPIGNRDRYFNNKGEYNKQGEYYLTTLESSADAVRGSDSQTGVIVSPLFIPEGGQMTFRVGGGRGPDTYVALCLADGTELQTARGANIEVMQNVNWDLAPYEGKKLFLKVVDQSTSGWGHVTVDDFQFDAEVLPQSPESKTDASSNSPAFDKPTRPPNFVVIFTDDQGYGDLSCFGGGHVSTPRIDQMAAEGKKLTSFYVAAPVCTPSRAALMTGCYPKRIDMAMGSNFGVLLAGDPKGLNPNEITIAEVLKTAGYKTGIFGKWHLGDQTEFLPMQQGFDEFFGIPYSHDIHPFHPRQDHYKFPPLALLENEQVIEMDPDADFVDEANHRTRGLIHREKQRPTFLSLCPTSYSPCAAARFTSVHERRFRRHRSEARRRRRQH